MMSAGLWNLASFLIALIILIAVHEWGHSGWPVVVA